MEYLVSDDRHVVRCQHLEFSFSQHVSAPVTYDWAAVIRALGYSVGNIAGSYWLTLDREKIDNHTIAPFQNTGPLDDRDKCLADPNVAGERRVGRPSERIKLSNQVYAGVEPGR